MRPFLQTHKHPESLLRTRQFGFLKAISLEISCSFLMLWARSDVFRLLPYRFIKMIGCSVAAGLRKAARGHSGIDSGQIGENSHHTFGWQGHGIYGPGGLLICWLVVLSLERDAKSCNLFSVMNGCSDCWWVHNVVLWHIGSLEKDHYADMFGQSLCGYIEIIIRINGGNILYSRIH